MITETISSILPLLCTAFMNLLIFLFLSKVYGGKYDSKLLYIILYVFTTALFLAVNRMVEFIGVQLLNFVFGFIYIHILSAVLFKSNYKKTFMYNSLFAILLMFSDILTVAILSIMKSGTFLSVANEPDNAIVTYVVYIFIMFFVWFIFVSALTKSSISGIKLKQIALLGLFTVFETFVVDSYAQEVEHGSFSIRIIIIMAGFLVLNIYLVYFVEQITKSYKEKYEYILMKNQSEVQLAHYTEISKKYEESRKMLHDIKKHLSVLNTLNYSDKESAGKYSLLIERKVDSLFTGFQCTNNILSIIMSQKISMAENENIKVETQIEDTSFDFAQDLDITAIFANLWDNAIEANRKLVCEKRWIHVIVGRVNDFIVISFENTYDGTIKNKGERLLSTKEQHMGVGLSIIKSAVEKYNGTLNTSFDGNVFKAEILMPIS